MSEYGYVNRPADVLPGASIRDVPKPEIMRPPALGAARSIPKLAQDVAEELGSLIVPYLSVTELSALSANMGTLTAGKIDVGNIEINADTERILFGAATAPMTGIGIFQGKDGADYELRAGNPAGNYIHWNGTTLTTVGGGTFSGALSAATGTFAGALSAATGTFAGALSAATGTFAGELSAATGTFSGALSAATGTFSGSLSAASGTFAGTVQSTSFTGAIITATGVMKIRAASAGEDLLILGTSSVQGGISFHINDPTGALPQYKLESTAGILTVSKISGTDPGEFSIDVPEIGFFGTSPVARPTGVAVSAAGIHAALVTLGLITA